MSLESDCGMIYWQGKTEELGEKPVPVPLCPPQIPHGLTRALTRASAVRGQRLTTWVMAQVSLFSLQTRNRVYILVSNYWFCTSLVKLWIKPVFSSVDWECLDLEIPLDLSITLQLVDKRWRIEDEISDPVAGTWTGSVWQANPRSFPTAVIKLLPTLLNIKLRFSLLKNKQNLKEERTDCKVCTVWKLGSFYVGCSRLL
jgi:hypothetical protein